MMGRGGRRSEEGQSQGEISVRRRQRSRRRNGNEKGMYDEAMGWERWNPIIIQSITHQ